MNTLLLFQTKQMTQNTGSTLPMNNAELIEIDELMKLGFISASEKENLVKKRTKSKKKSLYDLIFRH